MAGLLDKPGSVCVWINIQFDEDNDLIGWFDHDNSEAGGGGDASPIRGALEGHSYSASFVDAVVEAARALQIEHAASTFLIYDSLWDTTPGPMHVTGYEDRPPERMPAYLGAFPYETKTKRQGRSRRLSPP
jgi:hypothetical protein